MLRRLFLSLALLFGSAPVLAAPVTADVQTTWQLLDYLAVDYGGAIQSGRGVSASEYAEMREFSASAGQKVAALPPNPAKGALVGESRLFAPRMEQKGDQPQVAAAAHALGQHLLA